MFNWLSTHVTDLVAIVAAAHALAILIVNLTPTPKDDQVLGSVYNWIEKIAGLVTPLAKDEPNPATPATTTK